MYLPKHGRARDNKLVNVTFYFFTDSPFFGRRREPHKQEVTKGTAAENPLLFGCGVSVSLCSGKEGFCGRLVASRPRHTPSHKDGSTQSILIL
jgi:hypothetical protein